MSLLSPGILFGHTESGKHVKTCVPREIQTLLVSGGGGDTKNLGFCHWTPQTAARSYFLYCAGGRQESASLERAPTITGELPWNQSAAMEADGSWLLSLLVRIGSLDLPKISLGI